MVLTPKLVESIRKNVQTDVKAIGRAAIHGDVKETQEAKIATNHLCKLIDVGLKTINELAQDNIVKDCALEMLTSTKYINN